MKSTITKHVKSIPEYFKEAVMQYGEKIALTDESGSISYEELDKKSDAVARYLLNRGMNRGGVVAILMERSKECIVVMLGILKAGCTYMYIDKKYPRERIAYMIQDSEAEVVVSDYTCCTDDVWQNKAIEYQFMFSWENDSFQIAKVDGNKGAYLIYTSGSTGKPKGLMISHANFISLYEAWGKEHFSIEGNKYLNTAVIAPFVFDMCVLMIYTSLFLGHNLHIFSEKSKQSGQSIVGFLNNYQIDIMDATPNYLRLVDNYLQYHQEKFVVKKILCIGDVLNLQLAKNIVHHSQYPLFQLYNTYGPAECTVLMTFFVMDKQNIDSLEEVPIGESTSNASFLVVDEELKEVAYGEVGELIILGKCVGMGYVSKHVKQPGPFGVLKQNSYKTGDLVRVDKKKMLYFIGRVDRQCKINGYRVELEEIEKEIEKLDGIKEARVIVKREEDNFSRLFAFYTGQKQEYLKKYLKESLPHYMVPQEVFHCEEFPITQNGKVDYTLLLKKAESIQDNKEEEIGTYMIQAIGRLLGNEKFAWEESFFEAGGDSITLLALISEVSRKFHVKIDISRFFSCRNLEEMIVYVRSLASIDSKGETAEVANNFFEPLSRVPMNESQKKLYNLEKRAARNNFETKNTLGFSLIYKITFFEDIDTTKLENSINMVIQNNEIFYMGLQGKHNRIFCNKNEEAKYIKIRQVNEEKMIRDELSYLPLDSGLIMEVIQHGKKEIYLQVKHVYMDFISVQYFMDDVIKLYMGSQEKKERIGFFDYLSSNNFECEKEIEYWKNQLKLCPARTKFPIKKMENDSFKVLKRKCEDYIYQRLKEIAKKEATSVFLVLLSYFVNNIKKYYDSDYIRIGCYCPGRNYQYDNGVMGMFTNVLPFICNISDTENLFETVKSEMLLMLQHQNVSQNRLYQSMPLEEVGDGELFDICFNYQNDWLCMEEKDKVVERIDTINVNPDVTGRNFYFGVIEENGELLWEISYNQGRYDNDFVEEFISGMQEDILNGTV